MKYLKLFEDYNSENFYVSISRPEFNALETYDDNSYSMINKIRGILPYDSVQYTSLESGSNSISFIYNGKGSFIVSFTKDEWFKVKYLKIGKSEPLFYRCDQFIGLIRLFKDLGILKDVSESIKSNFDPYQEVSDTEFTNWFDSHTTEIFRKSDTLSILEIINSLWSKKGGFEINFFRNRHKISTPIKTLYMNDQVWSVSDHIFTREEFDTIEAYDHHHFLEITKWTDEWYTVFYDTYGGGHPHHFIVDTQEGIDWIQDKISTIFSDVYENGELDESREVRASASLTMDDTEMIEDLLLSFVEKWSLEKMQHGQGWNLERFDKFFMYLSISVSWKVLPEGFAQELDNLIKRIEKFGYNVQGGEREFRFGTDFGHSYFYSISKKEENISESIFDFNPSKIDTNIIEELKDLFMIEMSDWDSKEIDGDTLSIVNASRQNPEYDLVWRIRPASWMGLNGKEDESMCVDICYNVELWGNSSGKTASKLIHDLFKFSRKCVQRFGSRYGLEIRPTSKDMSKWDVFHNNIVHFHTIGELRFYIGVGDINESNMPNKFEADDNEMALIKWVRFKEEHKQIEFTDKQREEIQSLLDKSKFSHRWYSGLNGGPEALQVVYNKWTEHNIPQWKSGFNKYVVDITAREDEWFLISEVNNNFGYTDIYLADQFDQVINFIKSLDPDTDIEANPFGFNQF